MYNVLRCLLVILLSSCVSSTLAAAKLDIKFSRCNGFPIVAADGASPIVVSPGDAEVVDIAAAALCGDINLVSGATPVVVDAVGQGTTPIIIGTLGKSNLVDALAAFGKIDVARVKGCWETFGIAVVKNPVDGVKQALVIYGSNPRGTAYGVFELSRIMGVSPWCWWADVVPAKHNYIYVTPGSEIFGPPSVKYRGLFINDEDWGLQPWAAKNMDTDKRDIGPRTYEKVFELMLRLKANLCWPAMHPCTKAFWYYKENPEVARRYEIVIGSSHCEQMLRNNVDEWVNNFESEYGHAPGEYSWKTDSAEICRYWNDRVRESVGNDVVYTLGMRGVHDSGLPGYGSDMERRDALEHVIATQRRMIADNIHDRDVSSVPQMFCPYKEALDLYRMNLNLPDDVTLIWPDDNFGYMRQLSNPVEQKRKGGGGIYYHFSYWGYPQDYLWLGGSQSALTMFELSKAYALNCKDMWVFNVGDIKAIEYELQYAMDLAWDINSVDRFNADNYAAKWGAENFGAEFATDIYKIKREYTALSSQGRPEHVNIIDYTEREALSRLGRYASLVAKVDSVSGRISASLHDAYYELIAYPVKGAAAMNEKVLCARLSYLYESRGDSVAMRYMSRRAIAAYERIQALTDKYNKKIASGKWNGVMDYAPRGLKHFYAPEVALHNPGRGKAIPTDSVRFSCRADEYSKIDKRRVKCAIGLGYSGASIMATSLDTTSYTAGNIYEAPYAEYTVPISEGDNLIGVRCVPSFPIYPEKDLRYAISVNGSTPEFVSIKCEAKSAEWTKNVIRGFALGTTCYHSDHSGSVKLRIYLADPAIAVTQVDISDKMPHL